jgi:putative ABC transport system permease protein
MNIFELILKQMRQRLLSTLLTCLAVTLAVALGISISIMQTEGRSILAQSDYGFDTLVGPKGSGFDLVMNTIYHLGKSQGNIPYALYEDLATGSPTSVLTGKTNEYRGLVQWAVPYAVGDSYQGRRIVGTSGQLFGVDDELQPLSEDKIPEIRSGEHYTFAAGRPFHGRKFEAVVGSEVAKDLGLTVGKSFHATHGFPGPNDIPDVHPEVWTIVGVLNETHTANDRCLFIPVRTFYAIFEHETGLETIAKIKGEAGAAATPPPPPPSPEPESQPANEGYTLNPDGTITNKLPKADWEVSAILVKTHNGATKNQLEFLLRNAPDAMAVSPAGVMADFFDQVLPPIFQLLLVIASLVLVVSAVSILVSIYNSVVGRAREIAIMRALGATRARILSIICLEAAMVGGIGAIVGIAIGHLLAAGGSAYMHEVMGTGIPWWHFTAFELLYLVVAIVVAFLAGLVPALKAYQTPVAENLVG